MKHKHGAARYSAQRTRDFGRGLEIDVSHEPVAAGRALVGFGVDADIDHDTAGLEPLALDEFGLAEGGDEHVRARDVLLDVHCPRVADCDCCVHGLQQVGDRHADYVGASQHDRLLAAEVDTRALKQLDAPCRRARHRKWGLASAQGQVTDVVGRESVNVLRDCDARDDAMLVHVLRERELHEDGVYARVLVERRHAVDHLALRHVLVELAVY
jgi:hypothetical protein